MITRYDSELEEICYEIFNFDKDFPSFPADEPPPPQPIQPAGQATPRDITPGQLAAQLSTAGGGVSGQVITLTNMRLINVTDTGAINTEFSFTHNLGYVPRFALLLATSVSGNIYDNSADTTTTAWTSSLGYAVFSAANANIWLAVI